MLRGVLVAHFGEDSERKVRDHSLHALQGNPLGVLLGRDAANRHRDRPHGVLLHGYQSPHTPRERDAGTDIEDGRGGAQAAHREQAHARAEAGEHLKTLQAEKSVVVRLGAFRPARAADAEGANSAWVPHG